MSLGDLAFRALALLAAKWLLESWWLQALGAAYMVYVVLHHFVKGEPEQRHVSTTTRSKGFWRTTLAVELVDAAFAVDSILVAVALSRKLWVIYTAAVLGIVGIRVATTFVIKLLSRFPMLEDAAYFMVGWIGIKLALSSWALFAHSILSWPLGKYEMPHWVFWLGMGLISLWSLFMAWRQKRLRRNKQYYFKLAELLKLGNSRCRLPSPSYALFVSYFAFGLARLARDLGLKRGASLLSTKTYSRLARALHRLPGIWYT